MLTIKHNRAQLLHLVLTITGVVGLSVGDQLLPRWYWKSAAALGLCILLSFLILGRNRRIYRFKPNSPELARFFAQWYRREGLLTVYCNDLDWVRTKNVEDALNLKASYRQLRLYLRAIGDKANHLRSVGAEVYQIPDSLDSPHRFSIVTADDFERIICRSKVIESTDSGSEVIEFISASSTSDPYLVALAKDVLSICVKQ